MKPFIIKAQDHRVIVYKQIDDKYFGYCPICDMYDNLEDCFDLNAEDCFELNDDERRLIVNMMMSDELK